MIQSSYCLYKRKKPAAAATAQQRGDIGATLVDDVCGWWVPRGTKAPGQDLVPIPEYLTMEYCRNLMLEKQYSYSHGCLPSPIILMRK